MQKVFERMVKDMTKGAVVGAVYVMLCCVLTLLVVQASLPNYLDVLTTGAVEYQLNEYIEVTPNIQSMANSITEECEGDKECEAIVLYNYLRENHYYVEDVDGEVRKPESTLKYWVGDCEDWSILYCSLAEARDIQCKLKTSYNHVYSIVTIDEHSTPVDIAGATRFGRFLDL